MTRAAITGHQWRPENASACFDMASASKYCALAFIGITKLREVDVDKRTEKGQVMSSIQWYSPFVPRWGLHKA